MDFQVGFGDRGGGDTGLGRSVGGGRGLVIPDFGPKTEVVKTLLEK